eukprot:773727-Prymnesium_polylepis.1
MICFIDLLPTPACVAIRAHLASEPHMHPTYLFTCPHCAGRCHKTRMSGVEDAGGVVKQRSGHRRPDPGC